MAIRKPNSTSARCASDSLGPEAKSPCGIKGAEPGGRVDQLDPILPQFLRHRAEERVRVLFLEPQQHAQGAEIRPNIIEVLGRKLPGHDTLLDAPAGKGGNHLVQLAHLQPNDLVHQGGEGGVRLAFKSNRDEALDAQAAGLFREDQRQ